MEYFNRFNREKHFMTLLMWYELDKWTSDPGCQLKTAEKEEIDRAKDMIWNVAQGLFKRLDLQYGKSMIRDLEQNMLVVERSTKIRDDHIICSRQSADLLGDMSIMICNSQIREKCIKFKKCAMYQALQDAEVPTCCLSTDACPYRGERYSRKTKRWTKIVDVPEIERDYKQAVCQKCGEVWYAEYEMDLYKHCPKCGGELSEFR